MKLWITFRNLFSSTNCNRITISNTLLPKHRYSIQQSKTHLSRRKLWMTTTNTTCKWGLTILCLHLFTHRSKLILWIIQLYTHMVSRGSNPISNYSNSIYRICPTLRTNIVLRCNCYYKSTIRNSICRKRGSSMSMGWVRSRRHTHTIFRITFPNTICNCSNSFNSPTIPTPNRIK